MDGLHFLYHTFPGRCILRPLTSRWVSVMSGKFLDSGLSKRLIDPFIRKYNIDMTPYQDETYSCFNDFFSRRIKPAERPVDMTPRHLIAPCDGLMSVYPIDKNTVLPIKQSEFSMKRLLRNQKLSDQYDGGTCFVFRLCVNHYHRYCYVDSGRKSRNYFIPGLFHTVRPAALETLPVFTENSREYTVICSEAFGPVVQMEVGAMLVGRIQNYEEKATVKRGAEKGRFLYGGSTVIVLVPRQPLYVLPQFTSDIAKGVEIPVRMGQTIAVRI